MSKKKSFNFEETIANLTKIVEEMESGELPLEASLKNFEQGIGLIRQAQKAISDSEQSVQLLLQDNSDPSQPVSRDFTDAESEEQ